MNNELTLTMGDMLETNATRFGNEPAYIFEGSELSHRELLARAKQLASALHKAGIRRQDRISILSMNSLAFAEVLAMGQWSGIIVATVNFRLAPPEFQYIINDSAPRVLFFEQQYLSVIEQLKPQLKSIELFVCIGGKADWAVSYEEFIATGDATGSPFIAKDYDIACLIYTSGTTGRPKGCILGQREMRAGAQMLSMEMRAGPADRILLVMPLFHIGAMNMGLGVHFRGGTVVLHRQFDPAALLAAVNSDGVTVLHLAPTLVQLVLDHPDVLKTNFSKVHTLCYSAAAMPVPLLKRGMDMLGNVFLNLYGQTEVMGTGLPRELHRPNGTERERQWLASVGHPFPNVAVKIVDHNGDECPVDLPGEILLKSSTAARGYWNNHPATLETFRDGWVHTGDVGMIDEDGMLYLVDRKKDVIISGAENIYSREVEDAILTHPAVSECAVIGLPDEKWGEAVCAIITFKPGKTASESEIIDHTRSLIASYKKPRSVIIARDIPKLPTGKINKVELRKQYASK